MLPKFFETRGRQFFRNGCERNSSNSRGKAGLTTYENIETIPIRTLRCDELFPAILGDNREFGVPFYRRVCMGRSR